MVCVPLRDRAQVGRKPWMVDSNNDLFTELLGSWSTLDCSIFVGGSQWLCPCSTVLQSHHHLTLNNWTRSHNSDFLILPLSVRCRSTVVNKDHRPGLAGLHRPHHRLRLRGRLGWKTVSHPSILLLLQFQHPQRTGNEGLRANHALEIT